MLLSVVISINSKNPFRKKVTFSIIEINTKYIDVLHLCFIGCFLRKMRFNELRKMQFNELQLRTVLTQAAWNLLGPFDSESSYYL